VAKIRLESGVDLDQVAGLTAGFTGADLANLVNEAAIVATRRSAEAVTLADFTTQSDASSRGWKRRAAFWARRNAAASPITRWGTRWSPRAFPSVDPVHKVSIIPRGVGALPQRSSLRRCDGFVHT